MSSPKTIIRPYISKELSMQAFESAKKKYNKTASLSERLKPIHYAVFYQIVSSYSRKIKRIPDGLSAMKENEILGMWITRRELADILDVSPKTIYNVLLRLKNAGFIQVFYHGSMKPLEIRVDKNLLIIFDKNNPNYIPKSDFFEASFLTSYAETRKILPYINYSTNTFNNNITITERGVFLVSSQRECIDIQQNTSTNEYLELKVQKNKFNFDFFTKTKEAELVSFAYDGQEKRKKVAAKKEKGQDNYFSNNSLHEKREEVKKTYSRIFFAYLNEKVFYDKIFSDYYKNKVVEYISENYFSNTYTIDEITRRWERNLKLRVDIAADYIEKKFKGPDGAKFDRTYFFPLAFLDINKTDKNDFSFTKTNAFLKNSVKFKQLNSYNRSLDKELRYKFNKICRAVETGHLNYFAAQQKIKSLTPDSSEYIKQFNARFSGVYAK